MCSHKLTLSLSLAMPEFDKVLPSSAHQCTPVVLDYSFCGVAVAVLGLNWPRELGRFVSLPYTRFDVSR